MWGAVDRPNIIVIFTDDQGYQDVGCFGSPDIATPNLDRMAAEGMKFTDFYVMASVCSPSRAGLLTGCYPKRTGVTRVLFPQDVEGLNPDEVTIAEVLKTRGYATMCIGKWHLGHLPKFLPTRQGFDSYFGIPFSNDMKLVFGGRRGTPLMRDEAIVELPTEQKLLTKRYTEEAVRFITENRDRPFFLYLPHTMPHIPLAVSNAFRERGTQSYYGDAIEEIDWSVGVILKTLRKLDIEERTLVIFTSDNGPWLNLKKGNPSHAGGSALPLRAGKFSVYEGGMREPCIMWWPGKIPAGTSCDEVAATMDLLPTLAQLAGAAVPTDRVIDGRDIWPLMKGVKGAKSPHEVFCYYKGNRLAAIRKGRWKLHLKSGNQAEELYDLAGDIGERENVAGSHAAIVHELEAAARQFDDELERGARPIGHVYSQASGVAVEQAGTARED